MEKSRERRKRHFVPLLFIFSLASCSLLLPRLITTEPYSSSADATNSPVVPPPPPPPPAEPLLTFSEPKRSLFSRIKKESSLSCDRSAFSSDICVLRGDIRAIPSSSSIFLFSDSDNTKVSSREEIIRPYTRKWESGIMKEIDELKLAVLNSSESTDHRCDVVHDVPAVVFSSGGYIGNVYHDFRDCIIPLFLTSYHYNRRVIFVVVNYRGWWRSKYREILSRLSGFPPIDFYHDNRIHCFPEVNVGLHVHGELAVDPFRTTPANLTISDFQQLLEDSYHTEVQKKSTAIKAPTLTIISRKGSRAIENEAELVKLCKKLGFDVQVLSPEWKMPLKDIYRILRSSDAMLGVVGCALTHLLFMRPGAVFIQVLPLGTEWAAEANYGEPAKKIGLEYIPYRINPNESSLSRIYKKDDIVLRDPESVADKDWQVRKKIFLDKQTVRLDLRRFSGSLTSAYKYLVARSETERSVNS